MLEYSRLKLPESVVPSTILAVELSPATVWTVIVIAGYGHSALAKAAPMSKRAPVKFFSVSSGGVLQLGGQ